jgi:putative transposase
MAGLALMNREQRLGSYGMFQRSAPLQQGVWDETMRGLSTRDYGAVAREFSEAYAIEKSAVSENFIEAGREKVKELMERPLGELRLCAVLIDGTPFKNRQMGVALGISCDGHKTVLGLREGATEDAAVVGELLGGLLERGLDLSTPRLYILDGGKALHAAVRRHTGKAAFIQRCQVHKNRNVLDHLPEEHKARARRKLQNAYAMREYEPARRARAVSRAMLPHPCRLLCRRATRRRVAQCGGRRRRWLPNGSPARW